MLLSASRLVSEVEWPLSLAILSIEREIADKLEYDTIIDEFASVDKNRCH